MTDRDQRRVARDVKQQTRALRAEARRHARNACQHDGHHWRAADLAVDVCPRCGEHRDRFNKRRTPPFGFRFSRFVSAGSGGPDTHPQPQGDQR